MLLLFTGQYPAHRKLGQYAMPGAQEKIHLQSRWIFYRPKDFHSRSHLSNFLCYLWTTSICGDFLLAVNLLDQILDFLFGPQFRHLDLPVDDILLDSLQLSPNIIGNVFGFE